jgi:hypothetical protein
MIRKCKLCHRKEGESGPDRYDSITVCEFTAADDDICIDCSLWLNDDGGWMGSYDGWND